MAHIATEQQFGDHFRLLSLVTGKASGAAPAAVAEATSKTTLARIVCITIPSRMEVTVHAELFAALRRRCLADGHGVGLVGL